MRTLGNRPVTGRRGDMQNMMNVTLMMIVLAFFIVLNTLAVPAESKKKAALGSLTGTLGILPGGRSPMKSKGKEISLKPDTFAGPSMKTALLLGKFESYTMETQLAEKVSTIVSKGGVMITIRSDVLFEPGSARLKLSAAGLIAEAAGILNSMEGYIRVEGYTSDRAPSGAYRDRLELTIARAGAVTRGLVRIGGMESERLSIAGFGAMRPEYPNDSEENRAKNDRVRIIYKRAV